MTPQDFKARYFGAHIGCQAICNADDAIYFDKNETVTIDFFQLSERMFLDHFALLLTPLSKIADEHSIEVYKMLKPNAEKEAVLKFHKSTVKQLFNNTLYVVSASIQVCDYLRYHDYAIPFGGKSVDELVSEGLLKIL